MKIKIEIKHRYTGAVLFECEKEDNTLKDTVEEAVSRKVRLHGADLSGADLSGADLRYAILPEANLSGADLHGANLYKAALFIADLREANLRGTDLRGADFYMADLREANLRGADLYGANFRDVILVGAKNVFAPLACPSEGAFIGWKKVRNYDLYLIKLEIPEDARRSSATGRVCRCDKAKVLNIWRLEGLEIKEEVGQVANRHCSETLYTVGGMVYSDSFDENRWNESSHGIHFFIDKQEAINYNL